MIAALLITALLVCGELNKPREALIPFATEAYTAKYLRPDEVEWIKKSITRKNEPAATSDSGISIGYSNLAEHLVTSHDCPRWVVEMYAPDPVLLWRIHEGYELEALRNGYKDKPSDSPRMRGYQLKMRAQYGKDFQVMRVRSLGIEVKEKQCS